MSVNEALTSRNELPNHLWVEGDDDYHICKHLRKHYQIPEEAIEVFDKKGITNILNGLEVELTINRKVRLGIIVDADTDLSTRWQALRDILIRFGYEVPTSPERNGTTLLQEEHPTVGIWVMPDNNSPGMAEDFMSSLIPTNDLLWPLAVRVVENVIKVDCRFPLVHKSKALIHTWLAWQEEIRTPLGWAITKHYFDANAPQAQHLINWMRQLFDIQPVK